MADYSSTITTGGSAQTAAAADVNRGTLFMAAPQDEDLWHNFGTAAVADSPSILIPSGETVFYGPEWRSLITQYISVIGATTGKKFTIKDTKM
jgi:hypothetical protein